MRKSEQKGAGRHGEGGMTIAGRGLQGGGPTEHDPTKRRETGWARVDVAGQPIAWPGDRAVTPRCGAGLAGSLVVKSHLKKSLCPSKPYTYVMVISMRTLLSKKSDMKPTLLTNEELQDHHESMQEAS